MHVLCVCDWLWTHLGQRQEQRTWEHKKSAAREGLESAIGWGTMLLLLAVKSHSRGTLYSGPWVPYLPPLPGTMALTSSTSAARAAAHTQMQAALPYQSEQL